MGKIEKYRKFLLVKASAIDFGGETFSTILTFVMLSTIRLVSSLVLTRLLFPEAYGIVAVISSVTYIIELMSDLGVVALLVRHERGDDPAFINTLWTVRLIRGALNTALMFFASSSIANWYGSPELVLPLQISSLVFLIKGFESMSFVIAIRKQNSRLVSYAEVWSTLFSVGFSLVYSYYCRDQYGMIIGLLIMRALMVVQSYTTSSRFVPALVLEKDALKALFGFARVVGPNSYLSIVVTQFDKILIPRLFDLRLSGLYGLGGSMTLPVNALIHRFSQNVLYPRCARYFRENPKTAIDTFYRDNSLILLLTVLAPAVSGGAAELIVRILFDARYWQTSFIIEALSLSTILTAFVLPSENILVASGYNRPIFIANLIRLAWMVAGGYLGFTLWGFEGFVLGVASSWLPPMVYFWALRARLNQIRCKPELRIFLLAAGTWLIAMVTSHGLIKLCGF